MRYALVGALLAAGGVAALIEASRHHPGLNGGVVIPGGGQTSFDAGIPYGWSATAYDLVRIGGWALLIFGGVIIVFALIREIRRPA
jgi:hypothetical protein